MVVLLSGRKNKYEKEIIEILTKIGANYISDKAVFSGDSPITIISEYKNTNLKIKKGIVVMLDDNERFLEQKLPFSMVGICEESNKIGIDILSKNNIKVISCGLGPKNSVTISSINYDTIFITIQRIITNIKGEDIEPAEYKIKINREYLPFSIMASVTIMLLYGIIPKEL